MIQPKVLIVSPVPLDAQACEVATFMRSLTSELKRRGYPFKYCVLALNEDGSSTYGNSDDAEVVQICPAKPVTDSFESHAMSLACCTRHALRPMLATFKPDVISVHDSRLFLPFHLMTQNMSQKVQVTLHSSSLGLAHAFDNIHAGLQLDWEEKLAASRAKSVVLHSQASLHKLKRDVLNQFDAGMAKPSVFPIGLDATDYPVKKIKLLSEKIVVSYIGSLNASSHAFKRFTEVINLLPEDYRKHTMEARVYSFETMPQDIQKNQFSDIIFYKLNNSKNNLKNYSNNNDAEIRLVLSQTDILLMPSTHESTGVLALQAMLSNCKVIACAGTAMDEYLEPNSYCESECESELQSLARKLQLELDNIDKVRELQTTNYYRSLVDVPRFTASSMADSYISTWQGMLQ
jgi:glycosyltransferase involved in cell wall biosynthesis